MDYETMMMERFKKNKFAVYLGIVPEKLEDGYCECSLPIRDEVLNVGGAVHGGALYSLADMTTSYAAVSRGAVAVTASADFHYIASAVNTKAVHAKARVLKFGRRLINTQCDITDDNGKLLATAIYVFCVTE